MKDVLGLSLESWAWRVVMPALILGGNVAGFTLFVVAVLRITTWWREHRRARWEWRLGSLWWVAYFGLQLLGGLWSSNLDAWRLSLEVKSSLWFLPVLLAMPGRQVARDFWWSLGWSVTVYLSWRMLRAGWHQVVLDVPTEWRYARFSGDVHPTYMSLHLGAAFLGLGTQWARTLKPVMVWVVTVLFALSLGMLGSKAGIIAALVVAVIRMSMMWPFWGRQQREVLSNSLPKGAARWCVFIALVLVSSWAMSGKRFAEMSSASAVMTDEQAPVQSSSSGRVMVWQTSLEIIEAHPFGVGTGDVVPELMRRYERDALTYASERQLNPHNQWLQAGVAFGWPGMLVLTLALLGCLRHAWRAGDGVLFLCVMLTILHSGVESVLEVQRGVVFIMWMLTVQLPLKDKSLQG